MFLYRLAHSFNGYVYRVTLTITVFIVKAFYCIVLEKNRSCSWTCENAKMVAYSGKKVPQEESFKVQFILHVRFFMTSEVCLSEWTVVGLRRFVTSLSRLQGSH